MPNTRAETYSNTGENGKHYVRSVERAFSVIRAFGGDADRLSLSEVAARAELDRATARRLLLTLADLGYVRQQGREFRLTPKLLELGFAYLSGMSMVDVAQPHLSALAKDLNETAALTVLDGQDVVYLAIATGRRLSTIRITVGTRFTAHETSMGRILLAGLSEDELDRFLAEVRFAPRTSQAVRTSAELRSALAQAREQGWTMVDQELDSGLRGVAVPVRDAAGTTVAALNVSVQRVDPEPTDLTRYVARLQDAADAISGDLASLALSRRS